MQRPMIKQILVVFVCFLMPIKNVVAQELFPLTEPASTLPKNTLGVRAFSETYYEVSKVRNMSAVRIMYGLTPRLSVYATVIASNHHGRTLPTEFPYHNTPERGAKYPYKLNGGHLYAKYRFLSRDGKNTHLRMAAYAEGALVKTTHHETEPNIWMGDNSGVGGGIIATYLYHKFAVSLTLGGSLPSPTINVSPDPIRGLPAIPQRVHYGKSIEHKLSFGYLVYPKKYTSLKQTNINLYIEFIGKTYGSSVVDIFYGKDNQYLLENNLYPPALKAGWYVDVAPSVQFIFNSNTRLDLSCTLPALGKSWSKLYPVVTVGIQRYFYF